MSDSRAGSAATDLGVPGGGPVPGAFAAAARGPARGQGQPDPSRPRAGWPSHRPRRQARRWEPRSITTTVALRLWSLPGTGWTLDGRSASVTGSRVGPGTRPRPGCSLQPHSLAEPGKFQLPGS